MHAYLPTLRTPLNTLHTVWRVQGYHSLQTLSLTLPGAAPVWGVAELQGRHMLEQ